ncbi:MAG: hypothetical protein HQL24_04460 [Candidatus Omnitrophica bacterium]|nr:hypothetical protein [Candidatus Omnitrophota bacterium]
MDKNKKIISIVLFLIVPAILFWGSNSKPTKAPTPASTTATIFPNKKELTTLMQEDKDWQEKSVKVNWGSRNPFDVSVFKTIETSTASSLKPGTKVHGTAAGDNGLELMGILSSGPRPSAIINNEVVGLGAKINGMTVKEITDRAVILTDGEKEKILSMRTILAQ